jgi:PIN domain nuclease of toxin-antitoxin system
MVGGKAASLQLKIVPVDESIWIENVLLERDHRDPAARTIVATAELKSIPIVTKDQIIRDFYSDTI